MSNLTRTQKALYKDISTAVTVGIKFLKVLNSVISAGKEWITKDRYFFMELSTEAKSKFGKEPYNISEQIEILKGDSIYDSLIML